MYSERENTEIKLLLLLHPFQNCSKSSGGYSLKWLILGCATEHAGYGFHPLCPKQGI